MIFSAKESSDLNVAEMVIKKKAIEPYWKNWSTEEICDLCIVVSILFACIWIFSVNSAGVFFYKKFIADCLFIFEFVVKSIPKRFHDKILLCFGGSVKRYTIFNTWTISSNVIVVNLRMNYWKSIIVTYNLLKNTWQKHPKMYLLR